MEAMQIIQIIVPPILVGFAVGFATKKVLKILLFGAGVLILLLFIFGIPVNLSDLKFTISDDAVAKAIKAITYFVVEIPLVAVGAFFGFRYK